MYNPAAAAKADHSRRLRPKLEGGDPQHQYEADLRKKAQINVENASSGERRVRSRTITFMQAMSSPDLVVQDGSDLLPASHLVPV